MTDLGPGTPVICVDAKPVGSASQDGRPLTEGAIYFVERIIDIPFAARTCARDGCGGSYVVLSRPEGLLAYCPNRFRPLNDGGTDLVDDAEPVTPRVAEPTA